MGNLLAYISTMLFKLTSSSSMVSSLLRSTFILNDRDRKHSSQLFTTLGPPGAMVCVLELTDEWEAEWRSFRERIRLWGNTTNSATLKMYLWNWFQIQVILFNFFVVVLFDVVENKSSLGFPIHVSVDILILLWDKS